MAKIVTRLVGGLGNQLHCYAIGRAVAAHNDALLELDTESGFWNDPYGRQFLLDQFPALKVEKKKLPSGKLARLAYKIWIKYGPILCNLLPLPIRPLIVEAQPCHYQEEIHRTKYLVNPCLLGYWASFHYYQDIAQELRADLVPIRPVDPLALELLSEIEAARSCSIHWRSYSEEADVFHPSLSGYYQAAICLIQRKFPKVHFFVFSDDVAAAQTKLAHLAPMITFVDIPNAKGNVQSLIDFYLMYACDHMIVGNSTFSWWAAWLSDRDEKVIIAPEGLSPWGNDWLPPHWVAINYDC